MRKLKRNVVLLVLVGAAGYAGFWYWRTKNLSAVQRGWTVAESKGCFACHGPGGQASSPQEGQEEEGIDVPAWSPGIMMMYAATDAEIREWILDGITKAVREDPQQMKLREKRLIRMPAWRGLLSDRELHDVVAYVKAASNIDKPQDDKALAGREAGVKHGCFTCHGPQGRGCSANARSFKGYIPSWDGADFPVLAESDAEIREWILDGSCERLRKNPVAARFLNRQAVQMPAYRGRISEAEVDRIIDYIRWVRQHPY